MTNPFARKPAPPPGAPKRITETNIGAIHQMILHGRKLIRLTDRVNGVGFDYRIWISDYKETHIFALIPDVGDTHLGELIADNDCYIAFVRDTNSPPESEIATILFSAFWNAIERGCKVPTAMEFSYYD